MQWLLRLFPVVSVSMSMSVAAAAPGTSLLSPRTLGAARAGHIQIDGKLDELAWAAAPVGDRFIQSGPAPGTEARLHTTVRVLYDDDAVYVGVRMDDPAVQAIQAPIGRRDDENSSDWCFVEFDSRRDRRTAASFGVNPAGQQVDGVFVNDIEYDTSWNAVWDVTTMIDAAGWTAEYRIPWSVFPFSSGAPMTWGLNVYRSNPHSGETSNWSPRMAQLAGVVSRFNDLVIPASPDPRRFDVTPFALVSSADGPRAGVDAEVAFGNLAVVATLVPDFGQVEADPALLNLTSFELFLPERRPFFTEGLDAFRFDTALPLVTRGDSFADEGPFYSRRIGRASTILGAAKLYGRTDDGIRVGVLAASTLSATDADGKLVAVPEQAVVARLVDESRDGNAAVGAFASGLHREAELDQPRDSGVAGGDARVRWHDQTYEARGWVLASAQRGSASAIAALGARPWHNFQRPDAPRLRLPDGATRLAGGAGELRVAKVGGDLQGSLAVRAVSPGFDDNALGFQRNSDWVIGAAQLSRRWTPNNDWLRSWKLATANTGVGWSWGGELRAAVIDATVSAVFADYSDAALTVQHEASVLSTEWLRGGPALRLPRRDTAKLSAHTDTTRVTIAGVDATAAIEPGSGSRDLFVSPSLTWRLSDHVAGVVAVSYDDQRVGWQYVDDMPTIGRVHQRTAAASLQLDVAISPRMIVQLYAQPFVTIGSYDRFARVVDAHADVFEPSEPAMRPDGVHRSLTASAIARWEVRPGSFLTAVWNHHGEADAPVAPLAGELGRVLHQAGGNVVLVKLAWRFAP